MKNQEASQRYAKALYTLAVENKTVDEVLNQVREFNDAIEKDGELMAFFTGPTIKKEDQRSTLEQFFSKKPLSEEVRGLLFLLTEKRRLALLPEIALSFQAVVDNAQGVARGKVHSATTLFPEDRQRLEATISR